MQDVEEKYYGSEELLLTLKMLVDSYENEEDFKDYIESLKDIILDLEQKRKEWEEELYEKEVELVEDMYREYMRDKI